MRKNYKFHAWLLAMVFASSTIFAQNANSVYNQQMDEYLQNGQKAKVVELISNSKAPNYKKVTIDLKGKGEAYAFVAYDPSSVLPVGPAAFDTDDPGTMTSLAPSSAGDFIAAGTWADGVWYGEEYGTGNLYTIDESDGTMTLVGSGGVGFNGMAYDGSTMYACTSTDLYSVDLSTGASTMIGAMGNPGAVMIGLACDGSTLYGVDLGDDNFYTIDMGTGAATVVGSLGIDLNYAQDAEYDKDNGVLYLSAYTTAGELYTVDVSTGTATFVGAFPGGAEICGFAIPYLGITFPNDVGIMSITEPASGGDLGNAEAVTIKIKNYGDNAQSNFDVYFTMDGGAQNVETISSTIEPGETLLHTFATTVDLSTYGFYEFTACTMLANDDNTDNDCKDKTVENYAPSYCDATTGTEDEIIGHVVCGEIDNTSGWQGGVADYTDQYASIDVGGSEDITVTNTGGLYTSDITYVWVDWNDDFVFEQGGDEEFQLENVGGTGETFTGSITVPTGTSNGLHRMRVRMTWSTAPVPCGDASYGEVEDYSVNVGGTPPPEPCEDFDGLTVGGLVAEQLGGMWTTWGGTNADDATVSDTYANSGSNSFVVDAGTVDLIRKFANAPIGSGTGFHLYTHYMYVPTGFSGYFNVQSDPTPGEDWVVDLFFDDDGTGHIDVGLNNPIANFTYTPDTWIFIEINFDMESGLCEIRFDGEWIVFWENEFTIGGIDYFGLEDGGVPGAYFDDVCFLYGEGWDIITSVEDIAVEQTLSIFPNPASELVNIQSDFDITDVNIYNYAGQMVKTENVGAKVYQVNTAELSKGIYFFQINTVEGIVSKRIIIK